ncbi:hypothetical protein PAXRUDRAFT_165858 [Paxillus rubicundulus Ve08.2h10]|uniref:HAT C-terminal dimerisation domain-containing protein n=1 Tax=Paxillus rubicundulus Ve08.2h10 TaxID=930991 RepID=A0A0D0CQT7_9AGAM|nr:hypothetical protein PAXRUDRAFT_165858 [Paxillus rubicundulus Ve08.2h10]
MTSFQLHKHVYPLLFWVAMDVLPAQASSVPCERAFSSSKETCALRQNNLSPHLLEVLQVLKFKYKQEGLSFTSDLIAKPQDYSISGELSEHAALELIAAGSLGELNDLFNNSCSSDS